MKKLSRLALVMGVFVAFVFVPQVSARGNNNGNNGNDDDDHKVTICHRHDSVTNPYNKESVDADAVNGQGNNDHMSHTGSVATSEAVAQALKDNKEKWGDIIPPVPGVTPGLNWDADGQAIYYNECNYVPVYTCDLLDVTKLTSAKYQFDVTYTAENGATFNDVDYDFGDGSAVVNTTDTTYEHEYSTTGSYNVSVKVNFTLNNEVVSDTCSATVNVEGGKGSDTPDDPSTPSTPGTTEESSTPSAQAPQESQVQAPSAGVSAGAGAATLTLAGLGSSLATLGYGVLRMLKVRV